jgi:hypothetical protein
MAIEPVIDAIGVARHGVNNAIGRDVGAGIEVGRAVIVEVDVLIAAGVTVTVMGIHVGRE